MGDILNFDKRHFLSRADRELCLLAKTDILLQAEIKATECLLNGSYGEENSDYPSANINGIPTCQAELACAHENLTDLLNQRLLGLAYLLKISNHMGELIKQYGPAYTYSVSTQSRRQKPTSVDLIYFSKPENVAQEMLESIGYVYQYLHGLRDGFEPETWQELQYGQKADTFSKMFLSSQLAEPQDMASSIEVRFFQNFGVPLGYFEMHENVEKWLKRNVIKLGMREDLGHFLTTKKIMGSFPAVYCAEPITQDPVSCKIRHDFSSSLWGIIPETGITLGNGIQNRHSTPQRPYIVRQSPR